MPVDPLITLVLTSCGRHDLLKQTLDSFCEYADLTPVKSIIIEDSPSPRPDWLAEEAYPALGVITWLQNDSHKGQIASIDLAYSQVKTPYIFHCEDDWLFSRGGGWMRESKEILEKYPEIIMVALKGSCRVDSPKYPFALAEPWYLGSWNGLTFNPGLRRLFDYQLIGGAYAPHGFEREMSMMYLKMDYVMADLGSIVSHLGDDRRVCGYDT